MMSIMDTHDRTPADELGARQQPVQITTEPQQAVTSAPPKHLDPTRYGDWEKAGRCIDF